MTLADRNRNGAHRRRSPPGKSWQVHAATGSDEVLLLGTMEALFLPAFVCDCDGTVTRMTSIAERMLGTGGGLEIRQARLQAINPDDDRLLKETVARMSRHPMPGSSSPCRTLVIRSAPGDPPLVLDVVGLPSRFPGAGLEPRALVIGYDGRRLRSRCNSILRTAYDLTAAETEIAIHVAEGRTAEGIAALRSVSVATVRHQIKAVLGKVGVKRQVELAAKVAKLG